MAAENITSQLRVNGQTYNFNLFLYNAQGIMFPINTAALVQLSIEEDSREWFKRGSIILDNKENIIERRPNEFVSADANYKFRNDGRDMLLVYIKPVYDSPTTTIQDDPFPSDGWELHYIFSVYDVEDLPGDTLSNKKIKLYLWEYDYQLFVETTTSGWCTNNALYNLYPELNGKSSILPDSQRKIPTGLAIKDLISTVLDARSSKQIFSDNWDPGASNIFYTPPTNNNSIDDLDYLFNKHVASKKYGQIDGDVPLLYRMRYDKKWILTSLSSQLSLAVDNGQAGPLQSEQFYITSTTPTGVIIPSLFKTPQSNGKDRNLNLGYLSSISNYQFVDMSALDNTFTLINLPCSSNSTTTKQFNIDVADTTIQSTKDYFQANYVNKFSNNKSPTAMLSLNKTKTQSLAYKQPYSYSSTKLERYPDARNRILKSGFFLNQCINFTVPGSTVRMANTFIGLDRRTGSVDADFDEKLLGQWYIIKVTHTFTQNSYTNTITAVKPHADKNIQIQDNVL